MAGRSAPQDPNYKLYALYGGKAKYLAAKKARDDAKAAATKSAKPYEDANKQLLNQLNNTANGLYVLLNEAKLQPTPDTAYINLLKSKITKVKAKIHSNNNYIYLYETKLLEIEKAFQKKRVVKGSGPDTTKGDGTGSDELWTFNAPMVARENFVTEKSSLPKMLPNGPDIGDAKWLWTDGAYAGGKGTIQMDRQTSTLEAKAAAKTNAASRGLPFDNGMYGFRFHYNPTTINMSWSGMMGVNPVYESLNLDPANPMDSNLFTGMISFDIVLNRIQDLALLEDDGAFKYGKDPYGESVVNQQNRKEIVQKGTMYDLEYLFRTMHGYSSFTNFKSNLMDTTTNDPGWLPVRPVELHLGNKLRYRVRIAGLQVVHKIFSEKMVPILSVVSVSCMRYWDGFTDKKALTTPDTKK